MWAYTHENKITVKFLYYVLKNNVDEFRKKAAGMGSLPQISLRVTENFEIPLPPLPVQAEIVRILDKFSSASEKLCATLQKELELRVKQYTYYRDLLLSPEHLFEVAGEDNVRTVELGEIGEFKNGKGIKKADLQEEGVGCIHYGQIYTHYGISAYKTKSYITPEFAIGKRMAQPGDLVIATTSENQEDLCKPVVWLGEEDIAVSSDACIYHHSADPQYMAFFFASDHFRIQKNKVITGTKVLRVHRDKMSKFKIYLPPLPVQREIAETLDKFDTLVNSLTQGIPAEIEGRKKQYAYYRDKLLDFKRLNSK